MVRLDFPTTNNEAEYKVLVAGLDLTKAAGATSVVIYCNSQVVTNQVNGDYECKGERMKRYLDQVRRKVDDLKAKIIQIPRGETLQVNCLAKAVGATSVVIYCDSQVITNQVNGDYECKGKKMKRYLDQVRRSVDDLEAKIIQIPRKENERVDRLTKAASA